LPQESFDGHGAELNASLYHLFNPGKQIPLNGVLRAIARYSTFADTSDTSPDFDVPDDRLKLQVRTGLRWGGKEPTLFPSLGMELSVWYQGEYRAPADKYGFDNDRRVNTQSHLFWAQALLAYTLPHLKHNFYISLIGGTSNA